MRDILEGRNGVLYIPKEFYSPRLDVEIIDEEILKNLDDNAFYKFKEAFKDFDEDNFLTLTKYHISRIYTDLSLNDFYFAKFIRESARKLAKIFGIDYTDTKTPIATTVWLFASREQRPYHAEFKNHEYFDELTFTTTIFNSFLKLMEYRGIEVYVSQVLNMGKISLLLNYAAFYEKLDLI